jgi:uncharacterized membrane protein YfcA
LSDEDRWRRLERSGHAPSTPTDLNFNPLATGIGVFTAITIPVIVVGYTRSAGVNTTIIVLGIVAGALAGILVGIWVAHRKGQVWPGPKR